MTASASILRRSHLSGRRPVLGAGLALAGLLCLPAAAGAEQCALRYSASFARLPPIGQRGPSQAMAISEVNSLFGPRPDTCEPGGYKAFLESFTDFAREAMNAPLKQRDGMIRVAIAAAQQGPVRLAADECKAGTTLFRQTKSNIHAIADEAGLTPVMQQLVDTFDRSGLPVCLAPVVTTPPPSGSSQAQAIRVPQVPLPPWAVISLYEVRDLINQKQTDVARGKVEAILKWLETAQ